NRLRPKKTTIYAIEHYYKVTCISTLCEYCVMALCKIKKYDTLVDAHTIKLLENLTMEIGNEEVALQVTILSFEKLWHQMEMHGEPKNTFEWLQIEAKKLII
ncbi:hypothetical protein P3523_23330, partial [Vibrio parahaemolyticus]|nr:hypothetical protein [Vibrio parahaemolyticus]